jgi:hypothetical protein
LIEDWQTNSGDAAEVVEDWWKEERKASDWRRVFCVL